MDPHSLVQLADDTAVLSETVQSMIHKAKAILEYSKERLQTPNIKKTKYCNFTEENIEHDIFINDGDKIEGVTNVDGYRYLGMIYYPTNNITTIVQKNINKRVCYISRFYAWLSVNENTPIDVKLLVLDQCLFTALLDSVETWGDIS